MKNKKSGTKFIKAGCFLGKSSVRLIPFNISKTEECILEVGEGYLKFHSTETLKDGRKKM